MSVRAQSHGEPLRTSLQEDQVCKKKAAFFKLEIRRKCWYLHLKQ
jgi:hypothetical protein